METYTVRFYPAWRWALKMAWDDLRGRHPAFSIVIYPRQYTLNNFRGNVATFCGDDEPLRATLK